MKEYSAFELVKNGFWFGLGLIVPLMLAAACSVYFVYQLFFSVALDDYDEMYESMLTSGDVSKVVLGQYSHVMQGKQLLINGTFTNTNEHEINSVEIEAELFNEKGEFVYECSESIYRGIEAGVSENFQIKCGCSENGLPEFESVKLKVVGAD